MSSKLVKLGPQNTIIDPNDSEILTLSVMKSGKITLNAPLLHPRDTAKVLSNLATDIMFNYVDLRTEQQHSLQENKTGIV